jgi:hypothetical protein
MAKKQKRVWMPAPPKPPREKVSPALKKEVDRRAHELVENVMKPKIPPPPEEPRFNYVIDIFTRWHQSTFFYFCSTYRCVFDTCSTPTFEVRFARLKHIGNERFSLSYMRHTGEWWEIYPDLSLEQCLNAVENEPHFMP